MAYKKTLQKSGKAHQKLNPNKWIVAVGEHEGLIDAKLWTLAYEILNTPIVRNNYALLSGIITCGGCKARMKIKKRTDIKGFYYTCKNKCGIRSLAGIDADNEVRKRLSDLMPFSGLTLDEERALVGESIESVVWDGVKICINKRILTHIAR